MNYKGLLWILVPALWLWACSKEKTLTNDPGDRPAVSGVEVSPIHREAVPDYFEAVGTVRSRQISVLSSKLVGRIVTVAAQEGDRVKRGQILLAIDDRDLRAELQAAQAGAEEAGASMVAMQAALASAQEQKDLAAITYKRYEKLVADEFIAAQDFDEVKAKYKVALSEVRHSEELLHAGEAKRKQMDARVDYARTLLGYTVIASPYDGIVTAKNTEVGSQAAPGVPLMTVEQGGLYRLEVQVGESSLAHVKRGMAVPVAIDSLDGPLIGKVGEIVPAADPQSRTFTIKIDLPAHPLLRSGIYGKAAFSRGETQILLAPIQAVIERGQLTGVFVADKDGLIQFRLIKAGKRHDGQVEILSGLSAGERVVVKGVDRIVDGSRIEP